MKALVVFFFAVSALVLPAGAQNAQKPELKDRVMAVVDEDPILASELERVIALGLAPRAEGESDEAFRRRVLDGLIEERLRFHEIDRYGFEQVPVDLVEKQMAQIRARFPNDEALRKTLRDLGMTQQELRQLVARQLMVLTHVDEQLGPRVFVSLDDITAYYRNVLTPELQKEGAKVPPIEDVRDQIRAVLKEQRLNQELEKWTEELRRRADIHMYFDTPVDQLPPVVKRIRKADDF
ncbi:MAG TPA: SurA N-terminal domain-containing protein [Thermoanaerobaculia bacterium]|nr:SurA N-terminal domain-containing protein [Thermoanaerobaculia bacterium]